MRGPRPACACAVALVAAACAALGCNEGSPASPTFQTPGTGCAAPSDAGVEDAAADAGGDGAVTYAVCPPDVDASFGSLLTTIFSTSSCGTNQQGNCHSSTGASPQGTGNLLDFTLDAGDVYAELLGDGGGAPATNLAGTAKVLRVVPFDAGASMLYIKLTLKTTNDPRYGSGMPLTAPGSVCPGALDAVRSWIDQGAKGD